MRNKLFRRLLFMPSPKKMLIQRIKLLKVYYYDLAEHELLLYTKWIASQEPELFKAHTFVCRMKGDLGKQINKLTRILNNEC